MDDPIDVVKLHQQQEDIKFLTHFGGKFILHWVMITNIKCAPPFYFMVVLIGSENVNQTLVVLHVLVVV